MTINLQNAVTYDIETFPNCFTIAVENLNDDGAGMWEISHRMDQRRELMDFFMHLSRTQTPMIGFNNAGFDYPVIHAIFHNPLITVEQIYEKAMGIIKGVGGKFAHSVWPSDRFAPQIDLYKMHHFDNKAKATSLKWLQINMRSESVVDMPVPVGTMLTPEQTDYYLKPYNVHDVSKTKQFAHFSKDALDFRVQQVEKFGADVMNWNDTKIGEKMVIDRLGDELCFDRSSGRKQTRQTARTEIRLNDVIFPYINFEHPELNRVLDYLRRQVLRATEIKKLDIDTPIVKTKGVFTDLHAHVGNIDFHYGVGGIHGSVERKSFVSSEEWIIQDVDVAAQYPNIAIANNLAPAHLGQAFISVYSELPKERKRWQEQKGKKCVEANALKLASNGVYGKSNSVFSPFYDPQFTMSITVNGQLMLSMLAEQIAKIPSVTLIQINTDGLTYVIHKDDVEFSKQIWKWWENLTGLVLEDDKYNRMFVRDVNSYVAEDMDGNLKLKGAYWTPDPKDYAKSMAEAQPPAWHKNLSNVVSARAAVANMIYGVDPADFIYSCTNPYDFMCAVKVKGKSRLLWGDQEVQKTSRYYVSKDGAELIRWSPADGPLGQLKKNHKASQEDYDRIMAENGGQWDERIHFKSASVYEEKRTNLQAGHLTTLCNDVNDFNFNTINYDWYIKEAKKLII